MSDLHSVVAANIRAEAARQKISQTRIACALGLSQQLVSNRMNGKTPFTVDELGVVAEILNTTIGDLVTPRPNVDSASTGVAA